MRKIQKEMLLDLISQLFESGELLKNQLECEAPEQVMLLIQDCQECAIHIGEFIEGQEGEGTAAVSYLEEYCELLYTLTTVLFDDDGSRDIIWKDLQDKLYQVECSVKSELRNDALEILFLPYKASMWDCLESIWLAAEEDENCKSYVVPIPYFDKNTDGSLGTPHYEGGELPEYVPIVSWKDYELEKRRPDIIFIHNPYDEGNYITTVFPAFYASQLKKYTDMLVYIPYFISLDDVPIHFCICAGTLYADRVIVESEKVRSTYIREFRKMEIEGHCEGKFGDPEKKFLALGSPKYDKVLNTKREDVEIPEDWMRLIRKPDGTLKKVILYNTSVSALLIENEKVLYKLNWVFDIVRNWDDMVLLWRPHPLGIATCRAMRPELLDEYLRIVDRYKQEGLGIYDESADLNRAIAISDGYYGDWSSLVALYQVTGKPIMIEKIGINGKE